MTVIQTETLTLSITQPWPLTLTFNPMRAMVIINAKGQGQRLLGSKVRVQTDGRTDRRTEGGDCISLPAVLTRSVKTERNWEKHSRRKLRCRTSVCHRNCDWYTPHVYLPLIYRRSTAAMRPIANPFVFRLPRGRWSNTPRIRCRISSDPISAQPAAAVAANLLV